MILSGSQFQSVMRYLSGFRQSYSAVVFTPVGEMVVASVDNRTPAGELVSCGEYMFTPKKPLKERFIVRMDMMESVAKVLSDSSQDLEYRKESSAAIVSQHAKWHTPYYSLDCIPDRPEVRPHTKFVWDHGFAETLKAVSHSCVSHEDASCLDCVMLFCLGAIERQKFSKVKEKISAHVKPGKRVMVASDRKTMAIYEDEEYDCFVKKAGLQDDTRQPSMRLLIDRRHISQVIATCESGSPVEIRVGVGYWAIQCGRRTAIFPLRKGMIDGGWARAYEAAKNRIAKGTVVLSRGDLAAAHRQVAAVQGDEPWVRVARGDGSAVLLSGVSDDVRTEVRMEAGLSGRISPVLLSEKYVKQIANHFPADTLSIDYLGKGQPLVVYSEERKQLVKMIQPVREYDITSQQGNENERNSNSRQGAARV